MNNRKDVKWTKGPWEIKPEEVDKDYIRIRGTVWGGRYKVANVVTPTHEGVHPREVDETRANARLIQLSPQLMEFIQLMIDDGQLRNGYLQDAERLMRQARGES